MTLPTTNAPAPRKSALILLGLLVPIFALLWIYAPTSDPAGYLAFADDREAFGIQNAGNVLSNLPFLAVGLWGLSRPLDLAGRVLSAAVLLTAIGSTLFHLHPSTETLFWDRLPMAIAFTALLSLLIGDRVDASFGTRSLIPLLITGIGSVVNWRFGSGDLRPYVLVQYGCIAAIFLIVILMPRGPLSNRSLGAGLGCYALAKVFETADRTIFQYTYALVSGHTLKHLIAAIGGAFVIGALHDREARRSPF